MNENANERLRSVDQYEILRELGRGGTSVVYLVTGGAGGEVCAMKVLRKDSGRPEDLQKAAEHLRAEAQVLRALCGDGGERAACHPGIPAYSEDVCDENGEFAGFVMEYVEGRSLQQLLEEGATCSVPEAARGGLQLCAILTQLHRMDPPLIYRDLKPANILVRPDGTWILVDYGAVRKYKKGAGRDTDRLGTEGYAAPEQYGGWEQSDERTDIYGIGAVLHHMITGRPPLESGLRPLEELLRPSGGERLPRGTLEMGKILLRCCSVAPSSRFSSCVELEKALRSVIRTCGREEAAGVSADRIWRKFTLLIGTAAVFLACSGMLAVSSVNAGKMQYRILIRNAQSERDLGSKTEGYRQAVRARPEDPEAHFAFLRELSGDYVITKEEKDALDSVAYTDSSLNRMREKRPGEYARLQMETGKVFFACYEGGKEVARAAFENARRVAALWMSGREVAEAMGVVLGEEWTADRAGAWLTLERSSIKEAFKTGEGIFAAAVCKAAATEIALFTDRYEKAGADAEMIREVTETAVRYALDVESGWPEVPEHIREELRAAVDCAARTVE